MRDEPSKQYMRFWNRSHTAKTARGRANLFFEMLAADCLHGRALDNLFESGDSYTVCGMLQDKANKDVDFARAVLRHPGTVPSGLRRVAAGHTERHARAVEAAIAKAESQE